MKKVTVFVATAFAAIISMGIATAPSMAKSALLQRLDTDKDGTLDASEIEQAAAAVFDRLEKDGDGTVDRKELGARLGKKDFAQGDPDKDGTLSRDEFLALVQKLFKEADVDNEGTLDARELRSKAGRALARIVD